MNQENEAEAQRIKDALILTNAKLVQLVFNRSRWRNFESIDVQEFLDEGYTVLIDSVEKFDPSLGFRFTTYAVRNILSCFMKVKTRSTRAVRRVSYYDTTNESDIEEESESYSQLSLAEAKKDFSGSKLTIEGIDEQTRQLIVERMSTVVEYDEYEFIVNILNRSTPRVREILCRIITGESCESIGSSLDIDRRAVWQHKARFEALYSYCLDIFNNRRPYEEIVSEIQNNRRKSSGGFYIDNRSKEILSALHKQMK